MKKGMICPLKGLGQNVSRECDYDLCQWYFPEERMCALKKITNDLTSISQAIDFLILQLRLERVKGGELK